MLDAAAYEENHNFAVAFTIIAAASQGFGGLLAVLGMGQFGSSVAHLMSFSTGVMIYLSFMDIMVETKEKIGETYAGLAFFAGIGLFLLLEVCLPEVDGSQVADLLGMSWSSSSPVPTSSTADAQPAGSSSAESLSTEPSSQVRRRSAAAGGGSNEAAEAPASGPPRRAASSPARTRRTPTALAPPSSPTRGAETAARCKKPPQSPPPSAKRKAFEIQGEAAVTDTRKRRVAFSGLMTMISISLHNIPEGIAVYLTCLKGVESGLPLAIAMSLHNIPEGMAVAGPLYAATKSKSKAVLAATVSGGFEVVGCLLVQLFFDRITPFFLEAMLSLVAGIMVGLALIELLPSCLEILKPVPMGCSCVGGMVFMFLSKSASNELTAYLGQK